MTVRIAQDMGQIFLYSFTDLLLFNFSPVCVTSRGNSRSFRHNWNWASESTRINKSKKKTTNEKKSSNRKSNEFTLNHYGSVFMVFSPRCYCRWLDANQWISLIKNRFWQPRFIVHFFQQSIRDKWHLCAKQQSDTAITGVACISTQPVRQQRRRRWRWIWLIIKYISFFFSYITDCFIIWCDNKHWYFFFLWKVK